MLIYTTQPDLVNELLTQHTSEWMSPRGSRRLWACGGHLDRVHWQAYRCSLFIPPLMAGTIEISAPAGTGVASPPVYRTSSFPTNTLTCSRISPCSVTTRSRTPGWRVHNPSRASRNVDGERSISTWPSPPVKGRNGPGIRNVTDTVIVKRLSLLCKLCSDGSSPYRINGTPLQHGFASSSFPLRR